jgi:HSP20 family protein
MKRRFAMMTVFEPLRRGAEGFIDTLGEGWDWLRKHGAAALTRFQRSRDDDASLPEWRGDSWGLLASDVAETDEEVVVRIEAPGLEEKDFSLTVTAGRLIVRGHKHFEREQQRAHYHLFESAYGAFERSFPLPCRVDADRARARYRRGVLTVRLPRAEQDRRRRIQVKSA